MSPTAKSIPTWGEALDRIAENRALAPDVEAMIQAAREVCEQDLVKRVYRYEDLGRHRTELFDMALRLGPTHQETFALAMSDMGASRLVAEEIPLLAAAFRVSGDPMIEERLLEQLAEMTTWSPMQRPGWTLFTHDNELPTDGKDGNWLATGPGVRAIADALDMVPAASLPGQLRERLERLLEQEVASIAEDWRVKRTWFAKYNRAYCNQWVVPTEGLIRACLAVGRENHAEDYELGVTNLLASLDAHGEDGEFDEGLTYAVVTVASMIHAARAMAVEGDMRALEHPYLQRFPTWAAHHFQPGQTMVNAFDSGWAVRGGYENTRPLLSAVTACTGSRVGLWTLAFLAGGPSPNPSGLATRLLRPAVRDDAPPLYAAYERAPMVVWRDSWDDDANGVWVRGGHEHDAHDHPDRGHVNYVARGRPILIECGTPSYGHEHIHGMYTSGAGHNVLQLGDGVREEDVANSDPMPRGWQGRGIVAPISVHRLDEAGAHVGLRVADGYEGLKLWSRDVRWDRDGIAIIDTVTLAEGCSDTVLFRWHLGTALDVDLERKAANEWTASWADAVITIESSASIHVAQTMMLDNTLDADNQDHRHTCLLVRSVDDVSRLELTTVARPAES